MEKCSKCGRRLMADGSCYCEMSPTSTIKEGSKLFRILLALGLLVLSALAFGLNFLLIREPTAEIFIATAGYLLVAVGIFLCAASNRKIDDMCYSVESGTGGCLLILVMGIIPYLIFSFAAEEVPRWSLRVLGAVFYALGVLILVMPLITYFAQGGVI